MRGSIMTLAVAALLGSTGSLAAQPMLPPVYRLLATGSNDHVYTTDANEVHTLTLMRTHTYEGVAFHLFPFPQPGMRPVYRYVTANGTHLLDTQRPARLDPYARPEHILGYSAGPAQGLVPLHVWVHPHAGLAFYTTHPRGEFAAHNGYVYQGTLGHVVPGR